MSYINPKATVQLLLTALFMLSPTFVWLNAAEPKTNVVQKECDLFPSNLVNFSKGSDKPVFIARGEGHWDTKIRERGWIIKHKDQWRLYYTGYDGTRKGKKMLGLAVSNDGIAWKRYQDAPIYDKHWVEDMMIVKHAGTFYMFAEGALDQAQLLTSKDGIQWTRVGALDIRLANGNKIPSGPYGTPVAWFENGTWYLLYERYDKAVWLATSKNMKVWKNTSDTPVMKPGPAKHEEKMIAMNQVIKQDGRYYVYYHGRGINAPFDKWSTNIATSKDLKTWSKYKGNPLQPIEENKSSGMVLKINGKYRLYTIGAALILELEKKWNEIPRQLHNKAQRIVTRRANTLEEILQVLEREREAKTSDLTSIKSELGITTEKIVQEELQLVGRTIRDSNRRLAGLKARREILRDQIDTFRKKPIAKVDGSPLIQQLEKIVEIRSQELKRFETLFTKNLIAANEILKVKRSIAEAKLQLLQTQTNSQRTLTPAINTLNEEYAKLEADLAETAAIQKVLAKQEDELKEKLGSVPTLKIKQAEIDAINQKYRVLHEEWSRIDTKLRSSDYPRISITPLK